MSVLTFLHISDFHFKEEIYDTKVLFDEFLNDIELWRKKYNNNQKIDLIFITGDIAYSGLKNEYDIAYGKIKKILEKANCETNNLFLIPGNHDLDRNKISIFENSLKADIRINKNKLVELFSNYKNYKNLLDKFIDYKDFIENLGNPSIIWNNNNLKPWYSQRLNINGVPIRIIGLNTALLAGKNENNIDISIYTAIHQLKELMLDYTKDEYIIVLSHHPNDMLFGNEKAEIQTLMGKHHILHLYGHTHLNQNIFQSFSHDSKYLSLAAGCLYSKHEFTNNYTLCKIDFSNFKITIWPRRWYHNSKRWYEDPEWGDLNGDKSIILDLPWGNVDTLPLNKIVQDQEPESKNKSPFSLVIVPDRDIMLVGGETATVVSQIYYKNLPCKMNGVEITFFSDNDAVATLPTLKVCTTNENGNAMILLKSNEISGEVNITANAIFDKINFIKDDIKKIPVKGTAKISVVDWGVICGAVYDGNGIGLPNAAVTLWNYEKNPKTNNYEITGLVHIPENPQLSNDGRTSFTGRYCFLKVPSGCYCVTAEMNGHHYFTLVKVTKGTQTHNIVIPDYFYIQPTFRK